MLFKHEITKPCLQWALPSMCPYYSGLALIVLLYLNDTLIIDCISAEGKSQAVVCLCGANELADEPHILLHRRPLECCCSWLLSALLNKARWADRGWRVWSHHIHTHTHNPPQCHLQGLHLSPNLCLYWRWDSPIQGNNSGTPKWEWKACRVLWMLSC